MTYRIRKWIEQDFDLHGQLGLLELQPGGKEKEVVAEALKSKDFGRGHNVLMHAASKGHDVAFSSAIVVVKERVSGATANEQSLQ